MVFTSIALCLSSCWGFSQIIDNEPWCPKGTTWVYRSISPTSNLYFKFSYRKDSVLLSKPVKVLSVDRIDYIGMPGQLVRYSKEVGKEFVYASHDSVYWYDKVHNRFSYIYPLRPSVGDYWIASNSRAYCPSDSAFPDSDTLLITSNNTYTFGNRIFQTYTTSENKKFYIGTIIANIGSFSSPFSQINPFYCSHYVDLHPVTQHGPLYTNLACYFDSIRGRIEFWGSPDNECDNIILGIEKEIHTKGFSLFPNPTSNSITVKNIQGNPIKQISIASTAGNTIYASSFLESEVNVDVSYLPSGVYTIRLFE